MKTKLIAICLLLLASPTLFAQEGVTQNIEAKSIIEEVLPKYLGNVSCKRTGLTGENQPRIVCVGDKSKKEFFIGFGNSGWSVHVTVKVKTNLEEFSVAEFLEDLKIPAVADMKYSENGKMCGGLKYFTLRDVRKNSWAAGVSSDACGYEVGGSYSEKEETFHLIRDHYQG